MSATELTLDEKRRFHRDGFVVIPDAVPRELAFRARRAVNMHAAREGAYHPYHDLSTDGPLPDLINESRLGEIIRNTMGRTTRPEALSRRRSIPSPRRTCRTTAGSRMSTACGIRPTFRSPATRSTRG